MEQKDTTTVSISLVCYDHTSSTPFPLLASEDSFLDSGILEYQSLLISSSFLSGLLAIILVQGEGVTPWTVVPILHLKLTSIGMVPASYYVCVTLQLSNKYSRTIEPPWPGHMYKQPSNP